MSENMQAARTEPRTRPPWSTDLVGAGAAVVCALITWISTIGLSDMELTVRRGGEVLQIGAAAVAVSAGVSALVGFAGLRVLEHLTPNALTIWTVIAVVVAVVSLLGPLAATSLSAGGALVSLHSVVAVVVIASARTSRRRRHAWTRHRGRS